MTVVAVGTPRSDPAEAIAEIVTALRRQVGVTLRRMGAVVAVSGGIDSAVCAALAVRTFGPARVLLLALPERESDPLSLALARELARTLGAELLVEEITPVLEGAGCYARRDAAITALAPDAVGWRSKLVVDAGDGRPGQLPVGVLVLRSPGGEERRLRLPARAFREIVAASNSKQRVRAMAAYHHADRLHYAVVGTPNRLEYLLGFFVKGGDGLADVKPIAHLYKGEVYALAEALGVPTGIRERTPTTDTYSLPQTQEEFFFALPLAELDGLLRAYEAGVTVGSAAAQLDLPVATVEQAFEEIERKIQAAAYLHHPPLFVRRPEDTR